MPNSGRLLLQDPAPLTVEASRWKTHELQRSIYMDHSAVTKSFLLSDAASSENKLINLNFNHFFAYYHVLRSFIYKPQLRGNEVIYMPIIHFLIAMARKIYEFL